MKMKSTEKSRRLGSPRVIWPAWRPGWESPNKMLLQQAQTQTQPHTQNR